MTRLVILLLTGGGVAAAGMAMAEQDGPPSVVNPSPTPTDRTSPARRSDEGSIVSVKDGRLSVRVQNRPLDPILEAISREGRVAIIRPHDMGRRLVSVQFRDLPLDEGLRQILKAHDAFFFYGAERKAPASLKAVWVYPRGRGRSLQPVPPEDWASTTELEGDLTHPDPQARARAVGALVERKGEQAREAVLQALRDEDDQVRTRALYETLSADVKLPLDALTDLALRDASPDVRVLALEALAGGPEARAIAEAALNDPSPHVRSKAEEVLKGLLAAGGPRQPGQPAQGHSRKRKRR